METTYADSWSDMAQPCDIDLWVMKWRSSWPIIHGPVIFVLYLEDYLMYVHQSYFGSMNQYDQMFDLKINVGHWPIFHGPVILPYILRTIWCMNIIIWDYESGWPKVLPQNKYYHCDLYFMVQWFCVTSWRLFDVWTSYFGIKGQYDLTFDLKRNVGLYFMVQRLCLVSPRLFDAWVSYFQIMRKCDPNFVLKVNINQHDLYFMV